MSGIIYPFEKEQLATVEVDSNLKKRNVLCYGKKEKTKFSILLKRIFRKCFKKQYTEEKNSHI